jgi:hypothetical protein
MKGLFSVAAAAVILHGASLARAAEEASEPTPAQVRSAAEAFDRGREAYKAEEYLEAAEQFESADANAPSAAALELAIRARDKAGQLDRAATLAALALSRHPDDPNIQKIAPAIVQKAKADLFEIDLKCDDPCDVTVAGKIAPGRRATDRTVFVPPGTYAVRAGWPGDRSLSKSIEASKGAAGTLEFQAPAAPVAAPPVATPTRTAPAADEKQSDQGPSHKSGALPPTVFWVGVGVTAVVGGISIWSGIDTQNNPGASKVRDACNSGSADCNSLYDQGRSKQTRTNVLLGVTAVSGVATAVIGAFFTDWGGGSKPASPAAPSVEARAFKSKSGFSVQPWFEVGSGASVGALGRF